MGRKCGGRAVEWDVRDGWEVWKQSCIVGPGWGRGGALRVS